MSEDGPCYYCGKRTHSFAGNPSEWPLHFPHSDEPGVVKPHHVGCVLSRLQPFPKGDFIAYMEIAFTAMDVHPDTILQTLDITDEELSRLHTQLNKHMNPKDKSWRTDG